MSATRVCGRDVVPLVVGAANYLVSGSAFSSQDCSSLCSKSKALTNCINDECNHGSRPASGSWKHDCQQEQAALDGIFTTTDGVVLCKGSCDMCEP